MQTSRRKLCFYIIGRKDFIVRKITAMISLYLTLVVLAVPALCCSPPKGGFVPPTPAQKAGYADHVLIGEVRANLTSDPLYGDIDFYGTYGVEVYVQCTYKGSPMPGYITVGGAGFIPGMCTSKDLIVGKKYIIFLRGGQTINNKTVYEQSSMASEYGSIKDYLDLCGLEMDYPHEGGFPLKRRICMPVNEGPCKVYNVNSGEVETRQRGVASSTPPSKIKKTKPSKEVASMDLGQSQQSTTQDPGNGSEKLLTSFGLLLVSFLAIAY